MLLHQKIENGGGAGIKVDGIFGPETLKALKRVQGYHPELTVDGLAGDRTLAVLGLRITDTFNDPQLPATKKGVNQGRRTDWNVSPEETRQAMDDLQYAYSHPIELTAGREKPLRMVSPSAIVAAYPYMGVGQRALYNLTPSAYEQELLALLPTEYENYFSNEDLEFIKKQLKDLENTDPTKAAKYEEFLKTHLNDIYVSFYDPKNRSTNPRIKNKNYWESKPEGEYFKLLSQIPSLKGVYLTPEETRNVHHNRGLNHGVITWSDDGSTSKVSIPPGVTIPSWGAYASYANKPVNVWDNDKTKKVTLQPFKHGGRINYINLYK